MITAIHQPNFLPWQGYFYKIDNCDTFVFLDNVDIVKNSSKAITNRVKIKSPQGAIWLTIPIKRGESLKIKDIQIDNKFNWRSKHLKTIKTNYARSVNWNTFSVVVEEIYSCDCKLLSEFNINAIKVLCKYLNINTALTKASDLNLIELERNNRLINICKQTNAKIYLSGLGGMKYHDIDLFKSNNISINISTFKEQPYKQLFGEYIKGLSIIDYLFNKIENDFN